jgi:hypothetical protein
MPHSNRPAMPQVIAVDDQFGTHRLPRMPAGIRCGTGAMRRCLMYRVTRGQVCGGFEVRRGVVVACAPILRVGLASWWRLAAEATSDS